MIDKPRLIPAVSLGVISLVALELLAWTAEPYPGKVPASISVFAEQNSMSTMPEPEVWGIPNVIKKARIPDNFMDPETTGTAHARNLNNRADVMNGTANPVSPSERAILERLRERREEIDTREHELEMRERLLDTATKRLDGRVDDLKQLETKVDSAKAKPAEDEVKAVRNLVIMYEAMKPKDAARVFDRLSLDVLVVVVQQMNPRKMSDVLAAMAPDRAEKLTIALAASRRQPSTEDVSAPSTSASR